LANLALGTCAPGIFWAALVLEIYRASTQPLGIDCAALRIVLLADTEITFRVIKSLIYMVISSSRIG
jgi:hypothetical protein